MKKGTLVRLRMDTPSNPKKRAFFEKVVAGHGIGVVIDDDESVGWDIVLVFFPKLGVKEWRTVRLLEVVK